MQMISLLHALASFFTAVAIILQQLLQPFLASLQKLRIDPAFFQRQLQEQKRVKGLPFDAKAEGVPKGCDMMPAQRIPPLLQL